MMIEKICVLCKRNVEELRKHHLIPKQKGGEETIVVCVPCSKQIHALFSNKELKQKYNTLDKLKSSGKIQKWIKWVNKKNPSDIRYHGKK